MSSVSPSSRLAALGWNPFFESHWATARGAGLVPARVVAEQERLESLRAHAREVERLESFRSFALFELAPAPGVLCRGVRS